MPRTSFLANPTAGIGGTQHLSGEMLKAHAGVDITHIPYKGSGPAQADFIGNQVPLMVDSVTAALPHIQSKRAVTSFNRSSQLPDVPAVREMVDILKAEVIDLYIRSKGSEPAPTGPAEFDRFISNEIAKWGKAVKASGATAD